MSRRPATSCSDPIQKAPNPPSVFPTDEAHRHEIHPRTLDASCWYLSKRLCNLALTPATMQNVFRFRNDLIDQYSSFSRSFTRIAAADIKGHVEAEYAAGRYWPEPLIQLNPNYKRGRSVAELVAEGSLHEGCATLFRAGKDAAHLESIRLFTHQVEAVGSAQQHRSFVVTTGTGSGKSLAFFIPIVHHILSAKEKDPAPRTRAIIVYPMNALANSQAEEIGKFMQNPGAAIRISTSLQSWAR